jgi:hypothetical protein
MVSVQSQVKSNPRGEVRESIKLSSGNVMSKVEYYPNHNHQKENRNPSSADSTNNISNIDLLDKS